MSPAGLVSLTAGLTCGAAIVQRIIERRRHRRLRHLASQWRMNFNAGDQLRLASRVSHFLPIPGAANVTVGDVIYGIDGEFYRYVFTAEYTLGILQTKRRHVRVACFAEPRERGGPRPTEQLLLAAPQLPLLEQYRSFSPPSRKVSGIS
jgi:hypothetical protein